MFSDKCANPNCTVLFDYRHGRIFRFHEDDDPTRGVRHFWLCGSCANEHSLQYSDGAVSLIGVEPPTRVAGPHDLASHYEHHATIIWSSVEKAEESDTEPAARDKCATRS